MYDNYSGVDYTRSQTKQQLPLPRSPNFFISSGQKRRELSNSSAQDLYGHLSLACSGYRQSVLFLSLRNPIGDVQVVVNRTTGGRCTRHVLRKECVGLGNGYNLSRTKDVNT